MSGVLRQNIYSFLHHLQFFTNNKLFTCLCVLSESFHGQTFSSHTVVPSRPTFDIMLRGRPSSRLFSPAPSLESFATACSRTASTQQYPLASTITKNVPIYDLAPLESLTTDQRADLQSEWFDVLSDGPGVLVTRGLYRDHSLLDNVTATFYDIVKREREAGGAQGDHFAGAGKNDRMWNSFSKHGLKDPSSFVRYYSNPYLALICSSWLGPGYRITAQANNVKPGGQAQVSHRDYHLGFMSAERCLQFPSSIQVASQCLTLQGAVAHVDVPLESGPTRLLPFSQTFPEGYIAYRLPEFNDYFMANHVSLPLQKGDGIFFNPALFHAAGSNVSTSINRMVNLLQISSAFGKPMELIKALPIIESCWAELVHLYEKEGKSDAVEAFVGAVGEGYPFPTNLDRNTPKADSMAPETEQELIMDALINGKSKDEVVTALKQHVLNTEP